MGSRKLEVIQCCLGGVFALLVGYPCSADSDDLEMLHLWKSGHMQEIRVHCFEGNCKKEDNHRIRKISQRTIEEIF